MIRWIAQEHARDGAWVELVGGGGRLIGITHATEDTEMVVGGWRAEEKLMWSDSTSSLAWAPIKEIGRSGEGLRPECGRRVRVNEHGMNTVVESTQCALRLAVLRRSIWAREAEHNAIVLEVFSEGKIIKLAAFVSLETENGNWN